MFNNYDLSPEDAERLPRGSQQGVDMAWLGLDGGNDAFNALNHVGYKDDGGGTSSRRMMDSPQQSNHFRQSQVVAQPNLDFLGSAKLQGTSRSFDPIDTLIKCKGTIKALNEDLSNERKECSDLRKKLRASKAAFNQMTADISELKTKLGEAINQKQTWKVELERKSNMHDELSKQHDDLTKNHHKAQDDLKQAEDTLTVTQRNAERISDKCNNLEHQKTTLEELKDRLQQDIAYLEERSSRYEAMMTSKVETMNKEMETYREELGKNRKLLEEAENVASNERTKLTEFYNEEVKRLRDEWDDRKLRLEKELEMERDLIKKEAEDTIRENGNKFQELEQNRIKQIERLEREKMDEIVRANKANEEMQRLTEMNQQCETHAIQSKDRMERAIEQLNMKSMLLEQKNKDIERLTSENMMMKQEHRSMDAQIKSLESALDDSKRKVELLERLDKKREDSTRRALQDMDAEVCNLKSALEKSEAKVEDSKHLSYENHKLHMHIKELTTLFDSMRKETTNRYEQVIDKLAHQNSKLKKESVSLAGAMNRHLESSYRMVADKYDRLSEDYRKTPKYRNNNYNPNYDVSLAEAFIGTTPNLGYARGGVDWHL